MPDAHKQPGLVGCESTAARLVPTQRVLPLFDPILNVPTTVVHLDHLPGRKLGIGHDEPDPWEEFPFVPLDFSHHPGEEHTFLCSTAEQSGMVCAESLSESKSLQPHLQKGGG